MPSPDLAPIPPRPMNFEDIRRITDGLTNVSIELIQSGRADWPYDFSPRVEPCGRAGCNQKHGKGVLVAIDGRRFVNIGHCCAARYADELLWAAAMRSMERRLEADARDQAVAMALDSAQEKLHWLDNEPAIEVAISLFDSFCNGAKGSLLHEIQARAEKRNYRVVRARRLSSEERAMRRLMLEGTDHTRNQQIFVSGHDEEYLGDLAGVNCFAFDKNPRACRDRLLRLIKTLLLWRPADGDLTSTKDLQKATRNLVPYSNDLKAAIRDIQLFTTRRNFDLLLVLPGAKAGGVTSIERPCDRVEIERAPHWGRVA